MYRKRTATTYLDPPSFACDTPSPALVMGALLANRIHDSDGLECWSLARISRHQDGVGKEGR